MVSTNEKVVKMMEAARQDEAEGLTLYDRQIVGNSVRIEIPIADAPLRVLEDIADALIGEANRMKFHCRRRIGKDAPPEREIRFTIGSGWRALRRELRDLTPDLYTRNGNVRRK